MERITLLLVILSLLGLSSGCGNEANTVNQRSSASAPATPTLNPSSTVQEGEQDSTAATNTDNSTAQHTPTKYPIVLAHGFMGNDLVAKFKNVDDHLNERGFAVFEAEVSAANSFEHRAVQLGEFIDSVLAETGAEKVNIIGHSLGGLDSRYLIAGLGYGDRVASLTTMATPHYGTSIFDVAKDWNLETLDFILDFLGSNYDPLDNFDDNDFKAVAEILTVDYMTNTFNVEYPNDDRVYYQSWGAKTGWFSGDTMKSFYYPTYGYLYITEGDNDGLVSTASAQWGNYRGDLIADHTDLVGDIFGDRRNRPFSFLDFYLDVAVELQEMGY